MTKLHAAVSRNVHGLNLAGFYKASTNFLESLILAQNERWRRG